LTEVTLLDPRFLRVKPSMIAAIGMYTARRMLGGDWVSDAQLHDICAGVLPRQFPGGNYRCQLVLFSSVLSCM
jgi:hypothetical protein